MGKDIQIRENGYDLVRILRVRKSEKYTFYYLLRSCRLFWALPKGSGLSAKSFCFFNEKQKGYRFNP